VLQSADSVGRTSPSPAHYETAYEDVTVGGYICGTSQNARVYYPKTDKKVPVVSFAHGYGGKGQKGLNDYKVHHPTVAAAGFVLIHLESGKPVGECPDEWKDQMRSLEFLKSSPLGEKVFANLQGSGHMEPCGPDRLAEYSIAMMDCHLKSDSSQCSKVYGSDGSSLCGGKLKMAECLHENEPGHDLVAVVA